MLDCGRPTAPAGSPQQPGGAGTIPSIDWWVTSRCNLACDYCYGPAPERDPADAREAILRALENCSAAAVTFCGGEPLIVRELDQFARRLAARGKQTVLNTNGQLLRKRLEQGLELAFSVIGLSVDGSTEAVHRAMRGARADLSEVLRAARIVASAPGISLKLATVVSAVNQHDLPSLARMVGNLKPDIWRLYQYSPRGAQNTGQKRHTLTEDDFRRLADQAAQQAAPVPTAPSAESVTAGCLIVDPRGQVLVPSSTGYLDLGSCLAQPIDEIWAKVPSAGVIAENKSWLSVVAP